MNVIPTPATRKLANVAIAHARAAENGADAALRWLPELDPQQVPAFVGLVLAAAADAKPPMKKLPAVGRVTRCRDCGVGFTGVEGKGSNKGPRGLCRCCYDRHRLAGTVEKFPRVIQRKAS